MHKTILKQQYENFTASRSKGLDKTYDRFQKLISQLEIHGEVISQEDANLKLLRSLPSAWNNIALIMHNKVDLDELSMDDLYNNLKVYEAEIKSQSSSNSNSQNVAFVSSNDTSSTNEAVNTAHDVPAARTKEDLDRLLRGSEKMDLKWQVAMLTMRVGYIRAFRPEEDITNFAIMAYTSQGSSSSSSSNSEVKDNSISELKNIVNNKSGVGFDSQINENELHDCHLNKSEVFESASDNSVNEIEEENNQVNDRFKKNKSTASKSSKDSLEQPKDVRPSAPIIEDWDTDSDNDSMFRPKPDQTKPSYAKINFVKSDENTRKFVIKQHTYRQAENPWKSKSLRVDKRNWNGIITQKLGNGFEFKKKACFRVNHQNKFTHPHPKRNFVPTAVVTKSGQVPVNTAKQSSSRATTLISTARPVNTTAPKSKVNDASPIKYSYFKAHSPDQEIFDSGCSRHMIGNKSYLTDYQDIDGGFVAFAGSHKGGGVTCLFAKAIIDESNLWHRRLGYINFKYGNLYAMTDQDDTPTILLNLLLNFPTILLIKDVVSYDDNRMILDALSPEFRSLFIGEDGASVCGKKGNQGLPNNGNHYDF
ncbi:hypothetical protein Tco_0868921 [Tanacetum coccineum]